MTGKYKNPSGTVKRLLKILLRDSDHNAIIGDFDEIYCNLYDSRGKIYAYLWYWRQVFVSIPDFITGLTYRTGGMVKNYLTISFRNIKRQKVYTLLNLSGLAIGMACCILIMFYVIYEMSYDKYHSNADNIYRMTDYCTMAGNSYHYAVAPGAPAPVFAEEIPDIRSFVRIFNFQGSDEQQAMISIDNKNFEQNGILIADSTFYEVFSGEFIFGDPAEVLDEPGSAVLTQETAEKIFGSENPIGKVLNISSFPVREVRITGIVKDIPENSHFSYKVLISSSSIKGRFRKALMEEWLNITNYTYFLLEENADTEHVEKKMADIFENHSGQESRETGIMKEFLLQRLTDIHLKSHLESEQRANGNILYVYSFSIIAFFILCIACINFMNLLTARSAKRAKEIGLRKVLGAKRKQLIIQFLMESFLMTAAGLGIGSVIVAFVLPAFAGFTGIDPGYAVLNSGAFFIIIPVMMIFTGLLGGLYPAVFLTGYIPAKVMKGNFLRSMGKRPVLRNILVAFQFTISASLIAGTLIVADQLDFMKNMDLGFKNDQVLVVAVKESSTVRNFKNIKNELSSNPGINEVSFSSSIPGMRMGVCAFVPEGFSESETFLMDTYYVDEDFFITYEMSLIYGRNFSPEISTDADRSFIINETAAERMGFGSDAVGKELSNLTNGRQGKIIGIISDYHHRSLKEAVEPMVLGYRSGGGPRISIRIGTENILETISYLEDKWKKFEPNRSFTFYFLDEYFNTQYSAEERMSRIFGYFTFLAILIACLGVIGLSSYTAEQRRKEIGIRKVLGASIETLMLGFSRNFLILALISNTISIPVTYFLIGNYWLDNFAFRTNIGVGVFLITASVLTLIVLLTVSYQSLKTAYTNPVDSIKHE